MLWIGWNKGKPSCTGPSGSYQTDRNIQPQFFENKVCIAPSGTWQPATAAQATVFMAASQLTSRVGRQFKTPENSLASMQQLLSSSSFPVVAVKFSTKFQSSANVNSDRFWQFISCINRGMEPWGSLLCPFWYKESCHSQKDINIPNKMNFISLSSLTDPSSSGVTSSRKTLLTTPQQIL